MIFYGVEACYLIADTSAKLMSKLEISVIIPQQVLFLRKGHSFYDCVIKRRKKRGTSTKCETFNKKVEQDCNDKKNDNC